MPLYEYKCTVCDFITEEFHRMSEGSKVVTCKRCGCAAEKTFAPSRVAVITDTNFGYTGKVDTRLGDRPIEGRQDWRKRLKEKGLMEVDRHYGEKLNTLEDRMKPFQVTTDLMKNG